MSSAEQPHPIVVQLEAIEGRLGRIEKALGIEEKPKTFIRKRTMVLVFVALLFASGLMYVVNYVLNTLFEALPV
ncbi:hypothetical protein [Candidatus Lucifugimonas marina]|uniref:Uncharacterized protein n=1 Tax=Candidatus Lucifugimonas marina TaxID=3038979 RepID=A0AAJ6CTV0_9CHLR|nr:hypothetical protein [SAR202 cluster bacterium JH702]MDG0870441.1 hypothetical protein [SAR202 cluster bacterium JH639]WFG36008.1 hypothetical protein GKN94_09990 [SAR202 cluster bacterium JH545]WFG39952.1 hypothetical protein GKO48_10095 [SAR202 cluster bacterium JH1073]